MKKKILTVLVVVAVILTASASQGVALLNPNDLFQTLIVQASAEMGSLGDEVGSLEDQVGGLEDEVDGLEDEEGALEDEEEILEEEVSALEEDGALRVIYDGNGGVAEIIDENEYATEDIVTVLFEPEPIREDFNFLGWATLPESTEAIYTVDGETTFVFEDSVTLYAVWEEEDFAEIMMLQAGEPPYTVTFYDWNGMVCDVVIIENDGDPAVAPPNPSRDGYSFIGWDQDFSAVYDDMDVWAQYDLEVYTITYNFAGGGTNDARNPSWYTIESTPVLFYSPIRAGYEFAGWTIGFTIPGAETGNKTLTPVWVLNDAGKKSIFDAEYEIIVGRTTTGNGQGQFFIIVKDLEGHIINAATGLNGESGTTIFTLSGAGYSVNVVLHGNRVTDASQITITHYFVRYEPGTWGSFDSADHYYTMLELGDPTPPYPDDYWVPKVPGYVFTGWSTPWSATVAGSVIYTALWAEKGNYAVHYNTDGGTIINDLTGVIWTQKNLLPVAPTKTGYTFAGWYTAPDGAGDAVTNATAYSELAGDDDKVMEVTIYAKWEDDYDQTKTLSYTVKYYQDGVLFEALPAITETVWINAPDTLTVLPVDIADDRYVGYKFGSSDPDPIPGTITDGGVI